MFGMIKLLLKQIKLRGIFFRILLIYLISSSLILFLLSACLTYFLSKKAVEDVNKVSQYSVNQSYTTLSYILSDTYDSYYNLFENSAMTNIIYSSEPYDTDDYLNIKNITLDASVLSDCVDSFYIVNNKLKQVYSYVNGTTKVSTTNDFFDNQALEIINITSSNDEYLLYPRNLTYSIENKVYNKDYITFAFSRNNGTSIVDGGLIVNIDQQKLQDFLNLNNQDDDHFFVINTNGSIISCDDDTKLNTSFFNNNVHKIIYEKINSSNKNQDVFEENIYGEDYFINYKKSPILKFSFLYIVPLSEINEQVSYIKNLTITITLLFMVITFIFATMFSKIIYSPISHLVDNVKKNLNKSWQKNAKNPPAVMNEFDYLDTAYKQLVDNIDNINSSLGSMEQSKNREIIHRFLNDEYLSPDEFLKALSNQDIVFDKQYFNTVVFSLDNFIDLLNTSVKDIPLTKFAVYNIGNELLSEQFKVVGIVDNKNYISFIINADTKADEITLKLNNTISEIISQIYTSIEISISASIGSFEDELIGIPKSYKNAITASQYLVLKNKMSILSFSEISEQDALNCEYPYELDKVILYNLKNRNLAGALLGIHDFFNDIRNGSVDNINLSITQLLISLTRATKSLNNEDVLGEQIDYPKLSAMINACSYITKMEDICSKFVSDLIISKNVILSNQKIDQMDQACEYIRNNYSNPTLSIDEISEYVDLSSSYFRTLFKNSYDVSPLDYLTNYRIEIAKDLLETSDITAKDISEKVGYSNSRYFYGIFKSKTGLTATEYRKEHQRKTNN